MFKGVERRNIATLDAEEGALYGAEDFEGTLDALDVVGAITQMVHLPHDEFYGDVVMMMTMA